MHRTSSLHAGKDIWGGEFSDQLKLETSFLLLTQFLPPSNSPCIVGTCWPHAPHVTGISLWLINNITHSRNIGWLELHTSVTSQQVNNFFCVHKLFNFKENVFDHQTVISCENLILPIKWPNSTLTCQTWSNLIKYFPPYLLVFMNSKFSPSSLWV